MTPRRTFGPTTWSWRGCARALPTPKPLRAIETSGCSLLVAQSMSPSTLAAAGYGQFDPVASNEDAAGRARNRRIEITLQPQIDELVAVPADK